MNAYADHGEAGTQVQKSYDDAAAGKADRGQRRGGPRRRLPRPRGRGRAEVQRTAWDELTESGAHRAGGQEVNKTARAPTGAGGPAHAAGRRVTWSAPLFTAPAWRSPTPPAASSARTTWRPGCSQGRDAVGPRGRGRGRRASCGWLEPCPRAPGSWSAGWRTCGPSWPPRGSTGSSLYGMGGSSLRPEVICRRAEECPWGLDTTDPGQVSAAMTELERTVVVVQLQVGRHGGDREASAAPSCTASADAGLDEKEAGRAWVTVDHGPQGPRCRRPPAAMGARATYPTYSRRWGGCRRRWLARTWARSSTRQRSWPST